MHNIETRFRKGVPRNTRKLFYIGKKQKERSTMTYLNDLRRQKVKAMSSRKCHGNLDHKKHVTVGKLKREHIT